MSQQIRAIYENGLFRPLDPVNLAEHDLVSLVVASPARDEKTAQEAGARGTSPDDPLAAVIGIGDGPAAGEFERDLEPLLFEGPSLPADFSRADVYAPRD